MATTTYRYVIADVFTDVALAGNQLAVFLPSPPSPGALEPELRQALAREMNFSETVFVEAPSVGADADARMRIHTPLDEIPFAGHPVLGTAFVLAAERGVTRVRLETGRGVVPVELEGGDGRGWMHQPLPTWTEMEPGDRAAVVGDLGLDPASLVAPVEIYDVGITHAYFVVDAAAAVAALEPDLGALARSAPSVGTLVAAPAGTRWKVRLFGPGTGVPEDPATGSAAGPLAVHLARHGLAPWGEELEISQGAEIGRPSTLYARATGDGGRPRSVEVGGWAVLVARGEFSL